MEIRKLNRDEIKGFHETLYQDYVTELAKYGGEDGMTLPTIIYETCQRKMSVYIIVENRQTIGFFITENVDDDRLYRPMLYIVEFCILPDHRRQGVGTAAFKAILENADTPLFWMALPKNTPAVNFWRKMLKENGLIPVKPDPGQIEFAGKCTLYCAEQRKES